MDSRSGAAVASSEPRKPRYQAIRDQLQQEIEAKTFAPGQRLPPDAELATRFETSRLTVIRALRDLEQDGLVERKAGSGTFVRSGAKSSHYVFGLLMPDLAEGEVFEPISRGIASAGESSHHRLLWGDQFTVGVDKERQAEELTRYLISRKVDGAFFSPVELTPHQDDVNRHITAELDRAGIPIVLLDRCYMKFPERSKHDLVGIDNRRAGYRMTTHLLAAGCRRTAFVTRPGAAATVEFRRAGYREALRAAGLPNYAGLEFEWDTADVEAVERFIASSRPDGIVCANDLIAARLQHVLLKIGVRIPMDVRMVGINDIKYANFLPVPLTTLRQPCAEIGAAAMSLMLERIERPNMPTRDVLLDCEMIVRQSCGTLPQ